MPENCLKDDVSILNFNNSHLRGEEMGGKWSSTTKWWSNQWNAQRLNECLEKWSIKHSKEELKDRAFQEELLHQTISILLLFLRYNFTGPLHQFDEIKKALKDSTIMHDFKDPFEDLKVNGEDVNVNVRMGKLLLFVRDNFNYLLEDSAIKENMVLHWWHFRYLCIHQQILDNLASDLYELVKIEIDWLQENMTTLNNLEHETLLSLEMARAYMLYQRGQKSEEILNGICDRLNLDISVRGLLGIRTKYQQKPLPQLNLQIEMRGGGRGGGGEGGGDNDNADDGCFSMFPSADSTNSSSDLPKLIPLNDDTRLERIRFIKTEDNEVSSLPNIIQCLVFMKLQQIKRFTPADRLTNEEMEPYILTLLYQQYGPFAVRISTLLLNCKLESGHRRTVERGWKQCQQIHTVMCYDNINYSVEDRLSYTFGGFIIPLWQIQCQLCDHLEGLGLIKSALEIYQELKVWEKVIHCYNALDMRQKAAELIRSELMKKPTALLYCLLGDATDDPTQYEKAWEFSKRTSAKAQAHWGHYYFNRKDYTEAIEHYQESVKVNSLQLNVWSRMGFAAITLEKWELAVKSYITYTHIEPNGFESWNNLAKALIALGEKERAHRILQESLKCNFSNWKIWENFLMISVDTLNLDDALKAYERLCELKGHYINVDVLGVAINAIVKGKSKDVKEGHVINQEQLLKKANTLLEKECARYVSEPRLWEIWAILAKTPLKKSERIVKTVYMYMRKDDDWSSKPDLTRRIAFLCKECSQDILEAIDNHSEDETVMMITTQLNSVRLCNQTCLKALLKCETHFQEAEYKDLLEILQTKQQEIVAKLAEMEKK